MNHIEVAPSLNAKDTIGLEEHALSPSKPRQTQERQIALKAIAVCISLGFLLIIATFIMLLLAWFSESPTQPGVNEWMVSTHMTAEAIWALLYVSVYQMFWIVPLQDFALRRGDYYIDS
ncbi:hypothetical protein M422DRAFT_247798 [Sphaerobolus stellatus SS14]|uniref:Uncharacterized protein n=1 Tax=Sphaerobolus stellatus (strain SS14) TaxID=990650 RepID=A0A0C9UHZ9_SPHS4|nr:hypothetical protein M422DRAFT_274082 [Sphaerobolus stellatus SS14]KIJ48461.1 hypothetical protein M422DRAFT_247798 [Sphaerobolus stellatus SS14]